MMSYEFKKYIQPRLTRMGMIIMISAVIMSFLKAFGVDLLPEYLGNLVIVYHLCGTAVFVIGMFMQQNVRGVERRIRYDQMRRDVEARYQRAMRGR